MSKWKKSKFHGNRSNLDIQDDINNCLLTRVDKRKDRRVLGQNPAFINPKRKRLKYT